MNVKKNYIGTGRERASDLSAVWILTPQITAQFGSKFCGLGLTGGEIFYLLLLIVNVNCEGYVLFIFFVITFYSYFKWIRIKKSLITADHHGFGSGLWIEQHIGTFLHTCFFPSPDCVPTRAGDA